MRGRHKWSDVLHLHGGPPLENKGGSRAWLCVPGNVGLRARFVPGGAGEDFVRGGRGEQFARQIRRDVAALAHVQSMQARLSRRRGVCGRMDVLEDVRGSAREEQASAQRDVVAGTALGAVGRNEEELSIHESCWATESRRERPCPDKLLGIQGNIANCYEQLGRLSDSLRVRREMLSRRRKSCKLDDPMVLHIVADLGITLNRLHFYTETQPLMHLYLPVARRVLGSDNELTFMMIQCLASAISQNGTAPRGDLLESISLLEELVKRTQQVLGSSHPTTQRTGRNLGIMRQHLARLD